jgi:hypothetical protein
MNKLGAQLHPPMLEFELGLPFDPEAAAKWRESVNGQSVTLNGFRLNSGGHSFACVDLLRQAHNDACE